MDKEFEKPFALQNYSKKTVSMLSSSVEIHRGFVRRFLVSTLTQTTIGHFIQNGTECYSNEIAH